MLEYFRGRKLAILTSYLYIVLIIILSWFFLNIFDGNWNHTLINTIIWVIIVVFNLLMFLLINYYSKNCNENKLWKIYLIIGLLTLLFNLNSVGLIFLILLFKSSWDIKKEAK